MKANIFGMLALALFVLAGCTENERIGTVVQTGDEISFGISTPGKIGTRTVYGIPQTGADGNMYFPVSWEQDDEIAIYCPQASQPASKLVNYKITPSASNPAYSDAVTKIGDGAGLQWGAGDEHRFYGFYPASAVKGTETSGRIKANIPVEQKVVRWDEETESNGTTTYNGVPNTDLAYMFAYTSVKKSDLETNPDIPLQFNPLVTILEIIVNGPSQGSSPIKVSNINITSVDGSVALAGNFECLISDRSGTCTPLDDGTVTSRISVPCFNEKTNEFITLNPGDKINVKAFIIPAENNIPKSSLKITVSTLNGAARTKTLQTADIIAHKVNRVYLPALTSGGINYWMSNLDENIYASELSMPGSKFSFATSGNNASTAFQKHDLKTQFHDGVRAFIVQTDAYATYNRYSRNFQYGTLTEIYTKKSLESILSELSALIDEAQIANKKNEFAFVQITYNSASGNNSSFGAFQSWIKSVEYVINSLKGKYNIYTDRITSSTTLGELGGHIVLKVNFNNGDEMGQYINKDATIPAMFSTWTKAQANVPLYWGSPNSANTTDMNWFYQEATHIGNEAPTLQAKKDMIQTVFDESVELYQQSTAHNTWFMNDLGGCYSGSNPRVGELTQSLNDFAIPLLQKRPANASLGLVFMNFADKQADSGVLYKSDWLIQTVIDNNFKFALRKKDDAATTRAGYMIPVLQDGWDE